MNKKKTINIIELLLHLLAFVLLFVDGAYVCEECGTLSFVKLSSSTIFPICLIVIALFVSSAALCMVSLRKNNDKTDSIWHVSLPIIALAAFFLSGAVITGAHSCTPNIDFVQASKTFWLVVCVMFVIILLSFLKRSGSVIPKEAHSQQIVNNIHEASSADELQKYKKLLDSGVISAEEFEAKKKKLLGL